MKYDEGHRSANVEDQRGAGGGMGGLGGGGGLPIRRLGLGGTLVLLLLSAIFGKDFLRGLSGPGAPASDAARDPKEEELVSLVSFVLDDTQSTWAKTLPEQTSTPYRDAKLVLFTDEVKSGCGYAESAMGPFYCPADEKVYIDLGFYRALRQKLGAPGDFAQAYVIAHEIGHHVQNVLGTEKKLRALQSGKSKEEKNELSVRMELQADCYAGIWAHSTQNRKILEEGDVEEALGAASAVGDDRLQKAATGRTNPETWTHGSSAMRMRWFKRGFDSGRIDQCDTFGAGSL
ncbi:MAG TPA: neutral zinc metallopeptidase [Polyangiaceae bacterium]|jgi:predicted metalloprotease|nr:neutral zinc metallopeptidase [Polyangiaceae bacterium]